MSKRSLSPRRRSVPRLPSAHSYCAAIEELRRTDRRLAASGANGPNLGPDGGCRDGVPRAFLGARILLFVGGLLDGHPLLRCLSACPSLSDIRPSHAVRPRGPRGARGCSTGTVFAVSFCLEWLTLLERYQSRPPAPILSGDLQGRSRGRSASALNILLLDRGCSPGRGRRPSGCSPFSRLRRRPSIGPGHAEPRLCQAGPGACPERRDPHLMKLRIPRRPESRRKIPRKCRISEEPNPHRIRSFDDSDSREPCQTKSRIQLSSPTTGSSEVAWNCPTSRYFRNTWIRHVGAAARVGGTSRRRAHRYRYPVPRTSTTATSSWTDPLRRRTASTSATASASSSSCPATIDAMGSRPA